MNYEPVQSSNIHSAAYDAETGTAHVRFRDKQGGVASTYESRVRIPPDEWEKFRATFQTAESSGSHYHRHMKRYGFVRV